MNILLIRLRLIGDVVFTTPVIAALRRAYPSARLSYLVEHAAAPVVAASPHLNEIITVTHSRGLGRLRDDIALGWTLWQRQFDLVIDLHGGPRSAWLSWASRAPVRVGYDVPGRSWMYTRVVSRPRGYRPRHAVENQWDLVAAVDAALPSSPSRETDPVEMPVTREATANLARKLAALGIPASAAVVVAHVSAGNPFRRWPERVFAETISTLVTSAADRWVLVTAGPSDRDAARRILDVARSASGASSARVVSADDLSLAELRAACDRAALFIGGDSGPLHIASTSHVPIVGIYGPTLPERSAPWRPAKHRTISIEPSPLACRPCDQRTCVPGDFRCLTSIGSAPVLAAAEDLLRVHP